MKKTLLIIFLLVTFHLSVYSARLEPDGSASTLTFTGVQYAPYASEGAKYVTLKTSSSGSVSITTTGGGSIIGNIDGDAGAQRFHCPALYCEGWLSLGSPVHFKIDESATLELTNSCGTATIRNLTNSTGGTGKFTRYLSIYDPRVHFGAQLEITNYKYAPSCGPLMGTSSSFLSYSTDEINYISIPISFSVILEKPPLNITHSEGFKLNFGTLCQANYTQNVVLSASGNLSGNYRCEPTDTSVDQFIVNGENGESFHVDTSSITGGLLTKQGSSQTLQITNFTTSCDEGHCTILSNYSHPLKVGGTLAIPANTIGKFSGTYQLKVTY